MKEEKQRKDLFQMVLGLLPQNLARAADTLDEGERLTCEELRLRAGQPFLARAKGRWVTLPRGGEPIQVTAGDLDHLLARCTSYSVHTYAPQIAQGYVPLPGGCRLGVCGEGILGDRGEITAFRRYSSANLRLARQVPHLAQPLRPCLTEEGQLQSVLVLSPPGGGKTTLLRELVKLYSEEGSVSLVDERGEVAACREGVPQYDVGSQTDVLTGCPKGPAMEAMVRAMGPQWIALDEITGTEDCGAMLLARGCGCGFLATAHGKEPEDLWRRPAYRRLVEEGVFSRLVRIVSREGKRVYEVYAIRKEDSANAESVGSAAHYRRLGGGWILDQLSLGQKSVSHPVLCGRADIALQ